MSYVYREERYIASSARVKNQAFVWHVVLEIWTIPMSSEIQRVAIITGASKGIGKTTTEMLSRDGFFAVGLSRGLDDSSSTRRCDVREEDRVRAVFDDVSDALGRIDILVNCAGIAVKGGDPLEVIRDEWQAMFETNLLGTYHCSKHAIRHMQKNGYGRVINIASVAARSYSKTASLAYTCSKYAVVGLTRQLAAAVGKDGITVNCVAPSQTLTDMLLSNVTPEGLNQLERENPLARLANPEEIAETICFLVSERAAYINGAIVDVNGGLI